METQKKNAGANEFVMESSAELKCSDFRILVNIALSNDVQYLDIKAHRIQSRLDKSARKGIEAD